jgi:hypothetical protein
VGQGDRESRRQSIRLGFGDQRFVASDVVQSGHCL